MTVNRIEKPPKEFELGVIFDWRAYYVRFKEEHGEPIAYKGRLLFPDGWMYSATNYAGPEWEPTKDKALLRIQQRVYWTLRRVLLQTELTRIVRVVAQLKQFQELKNVPLQKVVLKKEGGVYIKDGVRDLGPDDLYPERIEDLKCLVNQCEERLVELGIESMGFIQTEEKSNGQS